MDEIFLEDEESGLLVSNLGRVIGKRGKELKYKIDRYGYKVVAWCASYDKATWKTSNKWITVHRLVARNFIPNPKNLSQINHIDENKVNNRVDNLEWCNAKYNNNYGSRNQRLKESQKKNGITKKCTLVKGGMRMSAQSTRDMSLLIGCSSSSISLLLNGKLSHVHGWHLEGVTPSHRICKQSPITLTNGDETITFSSHHDAARHIGAFANDVSAIANGKHKICHGWWLASLGPTKPKRKPTNYPQDTTNS